MAGKLDKSDFGYLGPEFQHKLVKCFMEDPKYFSGISAIVNQNVFTEPKLRMFVGVLKEYFNKEGVVPSYGTMRIKLASEAKTDIDIQEWDAIIKKIARETTIEGFDFIEDMAMKFFKQQEYTKIANKILEHLKSGDLDNVSECEDMFAKANLIGQDDEYGYSPYDLLDEALNNEYTISVPTGISLLDKSLGGGLDKKKVGLIIGSAGFGKTTLSTAIASYASTFKCDLNNNDGFKVLQIYFEDDDVDITRKHFSKITQCEARTIGRSDKVQADEIREWLENFSGKDLMKRNLRLKHFPTGMESASDIGVFIRRLTNSGFKPDLVIIDYFECLASEKGGYSSDSAWDREGRTMRRIENLAKELDVAIWVTTQGNKGSINSTDVVTMDQAGGSIKKVQVAQVVISIARSLDDIDKKKATLAVLKNRSGKSGNVYNNILFDNGTSTISCDDVMEFTQDEWKVEEEKQKERNRIDTVRELQSALGRQNTQKPGDGTVRVSYSPRNFQDDGLPF